MLIPRTGSDYQEYEESSDTLIYFIYLLETGYYIVSHKKKAMPIVKSANNSRPVYTLTLLANAYGTHCSIYVLKMKNIYDLTC